MLKLSRDISKIEDNIQGNKLSKQKLIKKDMRQNNKKPAAMATPQPQNQLKSKNRMIKQ